MLLDLLLGGHLIKKLSREGIFTPSQDKVDSLVSHLLIGMFIGARLTYVFVYNWDYYSNHLTELFAVWQGGLSFHGAIVGMGVGVIIYAKKQKISWFEAADASITGGAQGIFWGRMGNFINGELYGRVTDSPFGIVFKNGGPFQDIHPSFMKGLWKESFYSLSYGFTVKRRQLWCSLLHFLYWLRSYSLLHRIF